MKSKEEILSKREEILSDERLSYKTAGLFENAPLALHQLSQEVKVHLIEEILEIDRTDFRKLRGEK